jgi:coproporphyrinogen III oxidase|tara:strand:+ start:752 stop:979 length:228 start_codon:yes stop_codon:yes gene_type:complete
VGFAFTQDIGSASLEVYPEIVRRHIGEPWTAARHESQQACCGRHEKFNLLQVLLGLSYFIIFYFYHNRIARYYKL